MARSRNIKPGYFKNPDLAAMGERTMILFAGLWPLADREGRLKDDPRWLRVEILPYFDLKDAHVDELLNLLAHGKDPFIIRYEVDGRKFIQVVNWHTHQSPHHTERESCIPPPPRQQPLTNGPLTTNVQDAHIEVMENRESGIRNQESAPPAKKFKPPTVEAVAAYCAERNNRVDAQNFVDFYISKGWKVGREPMKDWRAAVRNWEKNSHNRGSPAGDSKARTRSGSEIVRLE